MAIDFGMYCFWEGEKRLGRLDGVICTTPGYMHGHEVVKVDFDPAIISPKTLVEEGKSKNVPVRYTPGWKICTKFEPGQSCYSARRKI
ncbi:MAG: hypothetical protein IPK94_08535 [Saprospiraceae bacterium]|nr:hypothetical protein [Saprospiraceae bacterium]